MQVRTRRAAQIAKSKIVTNDDTKENGPAPVKGGKKLRSTAKTLGEKTAQDAPPVKVAAGKKERSALNEVNVQNATKVTKPRSAKSQTAAKKAAVSDAKKDAVKELAKETTETKVTKTTTKRTVAVCQNATTEVEIKTRMETRSKAGTKKTVKAKTVAKEAEPAKVASPEESPEADVAESDHLEIVIAEEPVQQDWDDLDTEEMGDPLMVSEYVVEIFNYMKELEISTMPNPDYMQAQKDLEWPMRTLLIDWLIELHNKFRLLPETLYMTVNIIDRFLSLRVVSTQKLQLVGVTALFIAAKYEEVQPPSVKNMIYATDNGYTDEEIMRAERYVLAVLDFNLQYPSPMSFLRRCSKAEQYDIQTRTLAKYLMEISLIDHQFMEIPPSQVAGAGLFLAREMLKRGSWDANLVHYSGYTQAQVEPCVKLMMDFLEKPQKHDALFRKYSSKKFMKVSLFVKDWIEDRRSFSDAYSFVIHAKAKVTYVEEIPKESAPPIKATAVDRAAQPDRPVDATKSGEKSEPVLVTQSVPLVVDDEENDLEADSVVPPATAATVPAKAEITESAVLSATQEDDDHCEADARLEAEIAMGFAAPEDSRHRARGRHASEPAGRERRRTRDRSEIAARGGHRTRDGSSQGDEEVDSDAVGLDSEEDESEEEEVVPDRGPPKVVKAFGAETVEKEERTQKWFQMSPKVRETAVTTYKPGSLEKLEAEAGREREKERERDRIVVPKLPWTLEKDDSDSGLSDISHEPVAEATVERTNGGNAMYSSDESVEVDHHVVNSHVNSNSVEAHPFGLGDE
ncbi:G2/mitotic-specific cyclin [Irineochytrium annulatum]|nr:G2/mitotic-specific cyclin [Irineochytrium annulatum]